MISKVIIAKSFYGTCKYICEDERRSVVLETEGVRGHNYKLMATDFEMQQALRPSLSKAVFHVILSFYPGEKIDDQKMIAIAKEYLRKMGITNTQYVITKHIDRDHPHVHIVANRVNNNGETIKDNWIGLRGKKISQELTLKYDLRQALSKDLSLTHLERLNEKEANRYFIYQAILEKLPSCNSLDNLKEQLQKQGIEALYKYRSGTEELQGISFKIGEYKYKGSDIDRKFSLKNLQKTIEQNNKLHLKQFKASSATDNKVNNDEHKSITETYKRESSLVQQLIKPERGNEGVPYQLKRKKKKQHLRLH